MAETELLSGLELTKWQSKFVRESVRDSGFSTYMGTSPMDIIHVKNDLVSGGYTIRIPLIRAASSAGVTGNERLTGNEEQADQYFQDISWEFYRNAFTLSKKEREKSAVELDATFRPLLKEWASELIKYQIIEKFHSMNGVRYTVADQAARDAWLVANSDRVLFGAAVSNHSGGDHSAALANIDGTNDKLTASVGMLAKRIARAARPRIRPFKTGTQGREYFVMFCNPMGFRDLKNDQVMVAANREARARDVDSNPLFQDGDLIHDGIIYREIPEFKQPRFEDDVVNDDTHLVGVGASSVDVGVNFLCGAQALCMANKQSPLPTGLDQTDYGFYRGMGTELAHGIEKLTWANGAKTRKDVGMVTVYTSAAADA